MGQLPGRLLVRKGYSAIPPLCFLHHFRFPRYNFCLHPIAMGSKTDSDYLSQGGSQWLGSPSCQVHKLTYSPTLFMTGWEMKGFGQQMTTVPKAAHCMGFATWCDLSWKPQQQRLFCIIAVHPFPLRCAGKQRHCASTALKWHPVAGPGQEVHDQEAGKVHGCPARLYCTSINVNGN